MESEIDLLRQENARLVAKNYELEADDREAEADYWGECQTWR